MKLKAISTVIIAGTAVLAAAQIDNKPVGVGVRIGAFMPTDSSAQVAGNSWLDFGVDFDVAKLSPNAGLRASMDYAYRETFRSMPLVLNYVLRRGPAYALAGVGANFNLIPQNDGTTYSQTTFAYDLGIGYEFLKNAGNPIFIEGRFLGCEKTELNGFGVFLGIRI